jgi:hypothetical protein
MKDLLMHMNWSCSRLRIRRNRQIKTIRAIRSKRIRSQARKIAIKRRVGKRIKIREMTGEIIMKKSIKRRVLRRKIKIYCQTISWE